MRENRQGFLFFKIVIKGRMRGVLFLHRTRQHVCALSQSRPKVMAQVGRFWPILSPQQTANGTGHHLLV